MLIAVLLSTDISAEVNTFINYGFRGLLDFSLEISRFSSFITPRAALLDAEHVLLLPFDVMLPFLCLLLSCCSGLQYRSCSLG
jgi:hypothetical protein